MKGIKIFTTIIIIIILSISNSSCNNEPSAEYVQLETANKELTKNLEMYVSIWDDIVNKGQLDLINETYFDMNVTLVANPKNIFGIEGFKDNYKNFLTRFSNITFTVEDAFGQGDKIVKHLIFKGTHT